MTDKEKTSTSKFICLILRHDPSAAGLTLDTNGWADVSALLNGVNRTRRTDITLTDLQDIVATDSKQRYAFSEDGIKIRANQGHSVKVDVELQEKQPPDILYHGTAERFINAIKTDGLIPQSRLYVHLFADRETAVKVGKRHGKPVVLTVLAGTMYNKGYKFYLSENGVWLTECVSAEYLQGGVDCEVNALC